MRTLAGECSDGVDGPEEYGVAVDEAGRVTELQHRQALLIVEARLVDTDVVVEWKHLRGSLMLRIMQKEPINRFMIFKVYRVNVDR